MTERLDPELSRIAFEDRLAYSGGDDRGWVNPFGMKFVGDWIFILDAIVPALMSFIVIP